MARSFALSLLTAFALYAADPDQAEKYARAVKLESDVSRKIAERAVKPGESERERWYKRLDDVYTGHVPPYPAEWFDLITNGRGEWTRDTSRYFAELHDRIRTRLELKKEAVITRDQFADYAARYLGADSPPWKAVDLGDESRGVFKHLDANRDGGLTREECSPDLAERFDSADADKDGKINATEYRDYLTDRIGYEMRFVPPDEKGRDEWVKEAAKAPTPPAPDDPGVPRPFVFHDWKDLPKEVPGWFRELDTDEDFQVGLYEWAAAKRPLADFQAMDLNTDGLLEVAEYLRYRKREAEHEPPETTDLRAAAPSKKKEKKQ